MIHRDHSIDISMERESMNCQGIISTRSYMCLTSAEGHTFRAFNRYYENLVSLSCYNVMSIFNSPRLSISVDYNPYHLTWIPGVTGKLKRTIPFIVMFAQDTRGHIPNTLFSS